LAIIGLANPKEVGNDKLRPLCDLVRHAIAVPARYVNLAAISAPVDAGGVGRGLLLREHEVGPRQQARQAPALSRDLESRICLRAAEWNGELRFTFRRGGRGPIAQVESHCTGDGIPCQSTRRQNDP
jgi:hypothetical protein